MNIADEILSFVPAEQMSTILVLGGGDFSFLMRCRAAYEKSFMTYIDAPNSIRLFKEQHPDYFSRIPNLPLPMNHLKALRFDFIACFNFFSYFKEQMAGMAHYICYDLLQAGGMFFFHETVNEYNGVAIVPEIEKHFAIERRLELPEQQVAGFCRRKMDELLQEGGTEL